LAAKRRLAAYPDPHYHPTREGYADGMDVSTYTAVGAVGLLPDTR